MKKLLGLLAVGPLALAACGGAKEEAHTHTLSNGIYMVEATGFKSEVKLAVKVSAETIDSVKLVSHDETDSADRWQKAWTALENTFDGMDADELAHYELTPANVSGATESSNAIVEAVSSVVDNDNNLVNLTGSTYGDLSSMLGNLNGDAYLVESYEGTANGSTTTTACPTHDDTFKTASIPTDETSLRRIFTGTDSDVMWINIGTGWAKMPSMEMLTYDTIYDLDTNFKLAYFDESDTSTTHFTSIDQCTGYTAPTA